MPPGAAAPLSPAPPPPAGQCGCTESAEAASPQSEAASQPAAASGENSVQLPGSSSMHSRLSGRPSGPGGAPRRPSLCSSSSEAGTGSHTAARGGGSEEAAAGLHTGRLSRPEQRSCEAAAEEAS